MTNNKKTARLYYVCALSTYIPSYGFTFTVSIAVHALFKMIPVAISFLVAYSIGTVVTGHTAQAQAYFPVIIVLLVLEAVFYYLDIYVSHDVAYRVLSELRAAAYEAVNRIAPAALYDKKSGDIISIVMDDITILEWFYAHTIGQWIVAIILPLAALSIIGLFSYKILLVMLPFIVLLFFIPALYAKQSDAQGSALREDLGMLNAQIVDGVQGLMDILSFRWQKVFLKKFIKTNDAYNHSSIAYAVRSAKETALIALSVGCATLAFQAMSIYLIVHKELDILWLLPLFCLTGLVFSPLLETMSLSRNYGMIFAAAKRVFGLLQAQSAVADTGTCVAIPFESVETIALQHIGFSYPSDSGKEKRELLLKDVCFTVKKGETVALVGASGSGKTTIARLVQRFYDTDTGSITINGNDIRAYTLTALRHMLTVIPQEVYLFNRSIKENLLLAHKAASDTALHEAMRRAQVLEIVEKLPHGIHTIVGEKGMKLSGGEKARLAIAQAFLKNAPILIMDEASANLDSENERKINEAIAELKKDRITLIIAHRLSTIKAADRVILLKDGSVEADGSFDALMESSAYFRALIGKEYV